MRVLVVSNESNLTGLRTRLVPAGASPDVVQRADAALASANPHLDLNRLQPGDLVVVPDAPELSSAAAVAASSPSDVLGMLADQFRAGFGPVKERIEAGRSAARIERQGLTKALGSRGVEAAAASDESVKNDVETFRKALEQDEKALDERAGQTLAMLDKVSADLDALKQRAG